MDNFAKRILAWSTEQTAESLETTEPMVESALSQEQKDMVRQMREQHKKNNAADKARMKKTKQELDDYEKKGGFRNDRQYDVDSSTKVTAGRKTVEDVISILHLLPDITTPAVYNNVPSKQYISEGTFYADKILSLERLNRMEKHGIKITFIYPGKEGHSFVVAFKVV